MIKNRRTLRTIDINNRKVICHQNAREAYIYSKCIHTYIDAIEKDLEKKSINRVEMLKQNQQFNPLIAIQANKQELQYFSGWRWYENCLAAGINEIAMIVYEESNGLDPNKLAWQYLFSEHIYDMQRSSCLRQLVDLIDAIPQRLKRELLASNNARSAEKVVQNITGETRGAIRWSSTSKSSTNKLSKTILDELIRGN